AELGPSNPGLPSTDETSHEPGPPEQNRSIASRRGRKLFRIPNQNRGPPGFHARYPAAFVERLSCSRHERPRAIDETHRPLSMRSDREVWDGMASDGSWTEPSGEKSPH